MQRAMCVRLPDWPIQRLRSAQPELENRPVVLYRESDTGGRRVVQRSPEAAGVSAGMPVAEAQALRGRHEMHFERHDPTADREALTKLALRCQRYSPKVGLDESPPFESLLLDITGCAHLFGDETGLAQRVVRDFGRQGLHVRVAIADTVGAAWAVARYGYRVGRQDDGNAAVCVVPPGRHEDTLREFPVEALRLPAATVETLREFDIRRIGQLLALPRGSLPSRFGSQVLQRVDQALGHVPEPITTIQPSEPLEEAWSGEHALEDRSLIESMGRRLLTRLIERLTPGQQGIRGLQVELGTGPGGTVRVSSGLVRPSLSVEHIMDLLRLRLERTRLPGCVSTLRIRITETAALQTRQQGLFHSDDGREERDHLDRLLERLSGRFGDDAVLHPRLNADAQPEYAVRFIPVIDEGDSPAVEEQASRSSIWSRPLCLKQEPVPVDVMSVIPDGPPARFRWKEEEHSIRRLWGPERIETGWWRGTGVRRDYYRVETDDGRSFWLFRRLRERDWFLHGVFD